MNRPQHTVVVFTSISIILGAFGGAVYGYGILPGIISGVLALLATAFIVFVVGCIVDGPEFIRSTKCALGLRLN